MLDVAFYFSIGSRYSYLAASQVPRLQRTTPCRVTWCPVLSTAVFAGRRVDPFRGPPVSMQYDWEYRRRDATRWAALYGVPFVEPRGRLRLDPELLALAATAARGMGQGEAYAWQLFRAVFDGSTPFRGPGGTENLPPGIGVRTRLAFERPGAEPDRAEHSCAVRRVVSVPPESTAQFGSIR